MSQAVDISQFALSVEDLLRPLPRQAEGFRVWTHQLYYLRNMVVILPVLGAGLRIEQIVACYQLEDLESERGQGSNKQGRYPLDIRWKEGHDSCTYHCCHAPYVCARTPFGTQNHLW